MRAHRQEAWKEQQVAVLIFLTLMQFLLSGPERTPKMAWQQQLLLVSALVLPKFCAPSPSQSS